MVSRRSRSARPASASEWVLRSCVRLFKKPLNAPSVCARWFAAPACPPALRESKVSCWPGASVSSPVEGGAAACGTDEEPKICPFLSPKAYRVFFAGSHCLKVSVRDEKTMIRSSSAGIPRLRRGKGPSGDGVFGFLCQVLSPVPESDGEDGDRRNREEDPDETRQLGA